ncbi:MAG TPA: amidohydrolase family protein [Ignavibacteria bacterium]|nr:amidohydrolase family protein [Ignavibacteria bacterium]
MDEYILIKNGLVLTLDRKGMTGYFHILIRSGKIFLIDYERRFNEKEFILKYPETKIIDARNKIVMPGFFNSRLISEYSLNKYFFKKCNYENINSWLSLKLIDKYLSSSVNSDVLKELLKISFMRSLRNGELYVCESSTCIMKEFFEKNFSDVEWIRQYFNLAVYDYTMLSELSGQENFISLGFKADEDINNYSLASMKKTLAGKKLRLFIEASLSQKTFDSIKKVFGKPFITVLSEMELISRSTVISNPTHLSKAETEILINKNASVLISVSDYLNFQDKKTDFDEMISSDLNIITGTGYTGSSIFSELKILSSLISKNNLNSESLLKTAILNPATVFGVSNITGSIERNKSADMIILSLSDIRNILTIPEISSEIVSEFIIQNLSEKDISEVIFKGEILIKDKNDLSPDQNFISKKTKEISEKIYKEGKYFEFKEKYLMRGRVDSMTEETEEDADKKTDEIFVDMTMTGNEYLGEGEFTVLGIKEDEYKKLREKVKTEAVNIKISEINSLENELNFIEDDEDSQQITVPLPKKETQKNEITKSVEIKSDDQFLTSEEIKISEIKLAESQDEKIEIVEKVKKQTEENEENEKAPVVIKSKLKFGFSDEDKKK